MYWLLIALSGYYVYMLLNPDYFNLVIVNQHPNFFFFVLIYILGVVVSFILFCQFFLAKQIIYFDQLPKETYDEQPGKDYLAYLEDAVQSNSKLLRKRTSIERSLAISIIFTIILGSILFLLQHFIMPL